MKQKTSLDDAYRIYTAKLLTLNSKYGADNPPLTKSEFMVAIALNKNIAKTEGKHYQGNKRVAESLASSTVFSQGSTDQARQWQLAMKELGLKKVGIRTMRAKGMPISLSDTIKNMYHRGIDVGMDSKAISSMIANQLFGSD